MIDFGVRVYDQRTRHFNVKKDTVFPLVFKLVSMF